MSNSLIFNILYILICNSITVHNRNPEEEDSPNDISGKYAEERKSEEKKSDESKSEKQESPEGPAAATTDWLLLTIVLAVVAAVLLVLIVALALKYLKGKT